MKKLLLALALCFGLPSTVFGQCNGVFPSGTVCGNPVGAANIPHPLPLASFALSPAGPTGATQYNAGGGALGGYTPSQDCTVATATGIVTCLKTNNVAFASGATSLGTPANVLRTVTGNDPVVNTDCGKLLQEGTGSTGVFTITLPSVSGFASNCTVYIYNGDTITLSGKLLSGFPAGCISTKHFLFPGAVVGLSIVNGAWVYSYCPGQYVPTAAMTLLVNSGGSDSTGDGFTLPFATMQKCIFVYEQAVLYQSNLNQPTCQATSSLVESAVHYFPIAGTNTLNISSNTCSNTWKPSGANIFSLAVGNGGNVQFSCFNLSGTSTTCFSGSGATACHLVIAHNNNVVFETLASVTCTDTGAQGSCVVTDTNTAGGAQINIDNGMSLAGTIGVAYSIEGRAALLWNSTLTAI